MQMDKSGWIKYHLNLQGLERNVTSIQIDNGRKSQRLLRIVHELGPIQVKNETLKLTLALKILSTCVIIFGLKSF